MRCARCRSAVRGATSRIRAMLRISPTHDHFFLPRKYRVPSEKRCSKAPSGASMKSYSAAKCDRKNQEKNSGVKRTGWKYWSAASNRTDRSWKMSRPPGRRTCRTPSKIAKALKACSKMFQRMTVSYSLVAIAPSKNSSAPMAHTPRSGTTPSAATPNVPTKSMVRLNCTFARYSGEGSLMAGSTRVAADARKAAPPKRSKSLRMGSGPEPTSSTCPKSPWALNAAAKPGRLEYVWTWCSTQPASYTKWVPGSHAALAASMPSSHLPMGTTAVPYSGCRKQESKYPA
mmetsp:Transcript_58510/g.161883  ORF Transcript_58510/g.161883 Transcript_58510/m.161883 type:complete len:287 (+) Transcript_58510:34-894(+)